MNGLERLERNFVKNLFVVLFDIRVKRVMNYYYDAAFNLDKRIITKHDIAYSFHTSWSSDMS